MEFRAIFSEAAEEYGLSLTEKQLTQFCRYETLLLEENAKMNLTAITEPRAVAVKHFIDSLTAWRKDWFTADIRRVIDVGTGGGISRIAAQDYASGNRADAARFSRQKGALFGKSRRGVGAFRRRLPSRSRRGRGAAGAISGAL